VKKYRLPLALLGGGILLSILYDIFNVNEAVRWLVAGIILALVFIRFFIVDRQYRRQEKLLQQNKRDSS
jgi:uncharacterized membrane protein SirB2